MSDELLDLISASFEPVMAMIDAVDLAEFPLEPDLDPGRAPSPSNSAPPEHQVGSAEPTR